MQNKFKFKGKEYEYLDMSPNQTRVNERRVELPLGQEFIEEVRDGVVLEVGNVLAHYKDVNYYNHDVLDLYEKVPWCPDIINKDILTWKPSKKYDAVISISTLEHTGNPLKAIERILSWKPKRVFITLPVGVDGVEKVIAEHPEKISFMRRINEDNQWEEISHEKIASLFPIEYNKPFPFANAIVIFRI